MEKLKKIASVQDISCLGKCSLTVALPVISACGVECSIIPTAILSTHTGGFTNFTYHDLTSEIPLIISHWKTLNVKFDGLYSGFLGSINQIDLVKKFFTDFKGDGKILVDPAMADNGKMYSLFDTEFAKEMKTLCEVADIIIPNITEACFLTDTPYFEDHSDLDKISSLMEKLEKIAPTVILTGVSTEKNKLGAAVKQMGKNISYHMNDKIEGYFHGTGDLFASTLFAAFIRGNTIEKATDIAVEFVVSSILETKTQDTEKKFGVAFELAIPKLISLL